MMVTPAEATMGILSAYGWRVRKPHSLGVTRGGSDTWTGFPAKRRNSWGPYAQTG